MGVQLVEFSQNEQSGVASTQEPPSHDAFWSLPPSTGSQCLAFRHPPPDTPVSSLPISGTVQYVCSLLCLAATSLSDASGEPSALRVARRDRSGCSVTSVGCARYRLFCLSVADGHGDISWRGLSPTVQPCAFLRVSLADMVCVSVGSRSRS